ncbi:Hypothetical predicted protein [Pelobates cultripes]|uniref:Uncharacterized protein n=1 Tax=Pelobates cultripes TaxID=61616 RepID=A0AAD1WMT1_PELCU|nr:Hypothetical predicted protein [Pelobates cultripes]
MEAASQAPDSTPSTPARYSPAQSLASEPQMPPEDGWREILPNLLTKADFEALSDRLGRVVRKEVDQLGADLTNVEARMSVAEAATKALQTDLEHTNTAVTGQEADMAYLTTWIDDLENRGRRLNLRVRGLREGGPSENITEGLRQIFTQASRRYKYPTGWRGHSSSNHQDRSNHADQIKTPKGPSTNATMTESRAKQGVSSKQTTTQPGGTNGPQRDHTEL